VPAFLSDEWFAALEARTDLDPGIDVSLRQVVDDDTWRVTVKDGRVTVDRTPDGEADVTITTDRATAAAIAEGTLAAQDALAAGRLSLAGDLAKLRQLL